MAVICAKCGEELLGAINRCWRCGTEYESRSGETDLPPIRRRPIPPEPLVPEVVAPNDVIVGSIDAETGAADMVASGPNATAATPSGSSSPRISESDALEAIVFDDELANNNGGDGTVNDMATDSAGAAPTAGMRRGSPFRAKEKETGADDDLATGNQLGASPQPTQYPKNMAASVGPTLAIALGGISLCLAYPIPLAGLIVAGVGLGLGIWGLYSKRHFAAIIGMLLCCVAITISGFFGAAEVYQAIHGVSPWEPPSYPAP